MRGRYNLRRGQCNGSGVDQLFFSYECNEFMTIGTYKVIQVTE